MSNLYIKTTQNVKLFFTPASIGERMLAYGVDLLIKTAYVIIIYMLVFMMYDMKSILSDHEGLLVALFTLISLPLIFYTLVSETFMEGQTFGKKLLKIKVVKIDGYQAGFFDFLIRWIFSVIDIMIGYIPGLISMISTKHTQRLGDLAAGTAVITEKSKFNISHTILMNVDDDYQPYFTQNQVLLFSDNDMRIIKENAETAFRQGNLLLMNKLIQKVELVMNIRNPFKSERELIGTLLKDYNYFTGK